MKHKYVKSFQHLINMINQVIDTHYQHLTDEEFDEWFNNAEEIYYEFVYQKKYCDGFSWAIFNGRHDLVVPGALICEYNMYKATGIFANKNYNKRQIQISDEYKNK